MSCALLHTSSQETLVLESSILKIAQDVNYERDFSVIVETERSFGKQNKYKTQNAKQDV